MDKPQRVQRRESADSVLTPCPASDESASVPSNLNTASNLSTSPRARLSSTATTAVDGGFVPEGDRCLMDTDAIANALGLNITPAQWVTAAKMQLVQAYTQLQLAYKQQLQMKPQHELHVFKRKQVQQSQHAFQQTYMQLAKAMHALQQKHPKAPAAAPTWLLLRQLLAQQQPNPQLQQALLAGYEHAAKQADAHAQQMQVQMQMQMQMQQPQGASSSLKAGPLSGGGGVHMTMQQKEHAQKHALQCQQNKHAAAQSVQENPVTVDARYWQVQARLVIEYGGMVSQLYERFVQQDAAGGSRQKNLAIMSPIKQILSEGQPGPGSATALKTQFNVEEIRKVFEVLKKTRQQLQIQLQQQLAAAAATARQLQLSYSITIRYLQQPQIQQLGYTQMVRL